MCLEDEEQLRHEREKEERKQKRDEPQVNGTADEPPQQQTSVHNLSHNHILL